MESGNKIRIARAAIWGATAAAVFVAAITVLGEEISWLKPWLKDQHYHHWIGKGIWAAVIFFVFTGLTYVFSRHFVFEDNVSRSLKALAWALSLGTIIIGGFFVLETFHLI